MDNASAAVGRVYGAGRVRTPRGTSRDVTIGGVAPLGRLHRSIHLHLPIFTRAPLAAPHPRAHPAHIKKRGVDCKARKGAPRIDALRRTPPPSPTR
ncbi:hypothetical protein EVAR_53812_1 [Eumeta japonica]|uniref:Uncharacterized protein n=1 Tax=Eumeta variegata TaxID=151549 RepID=A0A4C1XWB9_EUMVA|nr:hypothetical protein EVAR_53812_1 [Eumeta japonica]